MCWRLDGPDPFPQGPPIPQGGAGYHCSIYILNLSTLALRYLIWSSSQYLILTYILGTYISIHACLAWNQLSSSYPTSYIAVGWRLADASPFPGPTHSTVAKGRISPWLPWSNNTVGQQALFFYDCQQVLSLEPNVVRDIRFCGSALQ